MSSVSSYQDPMAHLIGRARLIVVGIRCGHVWCGDIWPDNQRYNSWDWNSSISTKYFSVSLSGAPALGCLFWGVRRIKISSRYLVTNVLLSSIRHISQSNSPLQSRGGQERCECHPYISSRILPSDYWGAEERSVCSVSSVPNYWSVGWCEGGTPGLYPQ